MIGFIVILIGSWKFAPPYTDPCLTQFSAAGIIRRKIMSWSISLGPASSASLDTGFRIIAEDI